MRIRLRDRDGVWVVRHIRPDRMPELVSIYEHDRSWCAIEISDAIVDSGDEKLMRWYELYVLV